MDETQAKRIVEAVLFAAGEPMPLTRLASALPDVEPNQLSRIIQALQEEYAAQQRAFQVQDIAGGYRLVTDDTLTPWVRRALKPPRPEGVSRAAMETLAIIAYRQPVTKAELEVIRGVDVGGSLETLLERGLIRIADRKESPGRPFLYGTTATFLQQLGLKSLEDLPALPQPPPTTPQDERSTQHTAHSTQDGSAREPDAVAQAD
jgi:segregation and condensation protein B